MGSPEVQLAFFIAASLQLERDKERECDPMDATIGPDSRLPGGLRKIKASRKEAAGHTPALSWSTRCVVPESCPPHVFRVPSVYTHSCHSLIDSTAWELSPYEAVSTHSCSPRSRPNTLALSLLLVLLLRETGLCLKKIYFSAEPGTIKPKEYHLKTPFQSRATHLPP